MEAARARRCHLPRSEFPSRFRPFSCRCIDCIPSFPSNPFLLQVEQDSPAETSTGLADEAPICQGESHIHHPTACLSFCVKFFSRSVL